MWKQLSVVNCCLGFLVELGNELDWQSFSFSLEQNTKYLVESSRQLPLDD